MNSDQVYEILARPDIINYEPFLSQSLATDEKLINTIELFAFGDIQTYIKFKDSFIQVKGRSLEKLVTLSLLSILCENVGNELSMSEILEKLVFLETAEALENLLIYMVDSDYIDVTIDQQKATVSVNEVFVLRDAYNDQSYTLRVLGENDVRCKSVTWAREVLRKWTKEIVVPNKEQLLQDPK